MMRDITPDQLLHSLLADWHRWMAATPINSVDRLDDPTFRDVKSGRCWDSSDDIIAADLKSDTMKTIEFCVTGDRKGQGGLMEPYRAAIYNLARNQAMGITCWRSPRLPADPIERGIVVLEAKNMLMRKLLTAGVI
jgi:hypothetical protein